MTVLQIEYLAFAVVAAAFAAFAGFQVAPADSGGLVPPKRGWSWAAGAAAAAIADLGILQDLLGLHGGPPHAERVGAVGIGVLCAGFVALVAYTLNRGAGRGPRWRTTAITFSTALGVLTVVTHMVA
ncbi:hypothetical protein [Streptomyces montanisoli]|uniref:Uncharacterized protein n=1 Tax=Streptomyces montanisoli TaxID=2798581 RepID=A0A940MJJ0_9ACTN|nr:hypothetical protein [Streptomyces montanisoli]MBP0460471.1 hypothetical protein [Streptomyces montanisoli]